MATFASQWGTHGPRPQPDQATRRYFEDLELVESVDIARSAEETWSLIADVTRISEFSPECIDARWLDGVDEASVGARFEGTNRISSGDDELVWTRPCTVTECDTARRFGYVVGDRFDGTPASWWRFDIASMGRASCRVTQTFRHDPDGLSGLRSLVDADPGSAERILDERLASLRSGMRETLGRMKDVLEGSDGAVNTHR